MAPLLFAPLSSTVEPEFWAALSRYKLEVSKLDDAAIPIRALYSRGRSVRDRESGHDVPLGCNVFLDSLSLTPDAPRRPAQADVAVGLEGRLVNFNTVEAFKASDKNALLKTVADSTWSRIHSGHPVSVATLNPFLLLTFADLKAYKYTFWFAFPAFVSDPAWEVVDGPHLANQALGAQTLNALHAVYSKLAEVSPSDAAACIAQETEDGFQLAPLSSIRELFHSPSRVPPMLLFFDPSAHAAAAGWPLRNVLAFVHQQGVQSIKIVLWRDPILTTFDAKSSTSLVVDVSVASSPPSAQPQAVGWEKNANAQLGPRIANLGPMMDPKQLADAAVDLNLKLMKWRIVPELSLDGIRKARCLLLGAGTLGCYVSRTLIAWGVRTITLVDSGKVSYSNPVRQPLFEFVDCLEGGKPKAECAAAALVRICPGVTAKGVLLNIPMPGHPVPPGQVDMARSDVETLEALVEAHDVIYLLMDSRESRWLPTLLGASRGKLVINAALGFDSYLVMRHGVPPVHSQPVETVLLPGQPYRGRLGCYFCNDIVAPMDVHPAHIAYLRLALRGAPQSLTDRTLDQMCTVTRPGLAAIAGAIAVELMVSILQHPDGIRAHADTDCILGSVPHQLRGYLARFDTLKITGQAYNRCTACSDRVIEAFEKDGFGFLLRAFNDARVLEAVTGLDQLQQESDALEVLDWDEADEAVIDNEP